MATAFGPERFVQPSAGTAFDSPSDRFAASMDTVTNFESLEEQSRADLPPPNPPFTFPAKPPSSAPSSFSRATGRRPMSAIETPNTNFGLSTESIERATRSALPDFSFNPGALLSPDRQSNPLLTPPVSPHSLRNLPSPSRPAGHGHRRGGSEFVGGRLREGNSIAIMSTSPTKSESGFVTPTFQPPRRRHRRGISGAISTNDLPTLQPPVFDSHLTRGSSAPTSPTGFDQAENSPIPPQSNLSTPAELMEKNPLDQTQVTQPSDNSSTEGSPKQSKNGTKARVGFSDTLEFIPRPLSLVSTETSSTATARPGHSVSGSISSIVSGASPSGRGSPAPLSRAPTREIATDSRPSTAGAILERTQDLSKSTSSPKRRNSIPTLLHLTEALKTEQPEPSPTKTPKRWSFFAREREPIVNTTSPTKGRPQSSSSLDSISRAASASEHGSESTVEVSEVTTKKQKKHSKKGKKKVKGWAGSILPRKPKSHDKRSKSESLPPTPITPAAPLEDEEEMYGEPELMETSTPVLTVTESPNLSEDVEHSPKRAEEESRFPMIDLDAALGPFNTPLPLNPEWEAAQRAAGNTGKRRLHSAQGMKGFSGPGMHYHRRAESAPDLPPFDPGRLSIHRFSSNSTMADVFEEDEEDEDGHSKTRHARRVGKDSESDRDATPSATTVSDPLLDVQDKQSIHSSTHSMRRTNSSLSDQDQVTTSSVRAERSRSSLHDSVIAEEIPSVIFRTPFVYSDRGEGSASNSPSLSKPSGNKDLAPVDISPIHLPAPANAPNSPYAMSHSSSFPSPRTPMSVEVQRLSTAPSSVADENNFQSLLLVGEPGPEVRISMDYDIPSLTSSNSTMTRESMFLPSQRQSQPILREPRPVSVSSAAFGRRRSSLASLSRLISSSHGERSKLSMEVTLDGEPAEKSTKHSRSKRLSRMMQFWKPSKEGNSK